MTQLSKLFFAIGTAIALVSIGFLWGFETSQRQVREWERSAEKQIKATAEITTRLMICRDEIREMK